MLLPFPLMSMATQKKNRLVLSLINFFLNTFLLHLVFGMIKPGHLFISILYSTDTIPIIFYVGIYVITNSMPQNYCLLYIKQCGVSAAFIYKNKIILQPIK